MTQRDVYINASQVMCASLHSQASDYVASQEGTPVAFKSFNAQAKLADFDQIMEYFDTLLSPLFAKLKLTVQQRAQTTLMLGSTSLDISAVAVKDEQQLWLSKTDKIARALVEKYGLSDIEFTFSTACTASANACLYASRLISQGEVEHALVIGFEFYNPLTVEGFKSLDLISENGLNAFAQARSGLVLGEGLGAVYLSAQPSAQSHFKLLGGASSCDTYSLTMTQADGSHIVQVINQALAQSQLVAQQIDLIKVHGTATLGNDEAESNALAQLFKHPRPPIIAFKPFTGHTLGACGVIELALFDQLMSAPEAKLPIPDYVSDKKLAVMWPFYNNQQPQQINTVLFNYFGFGGNNAALVVQRLGRS